MDRRARTHELSAPLGPERIEHHIGEAFIRGDRPRLVIVGIDAYVDDVGWSKVGGVSAGWYAGQYREQRHRFDRGVAARASVLLEALGAEDDSPIEHAYPTNAIKRHLTASEGKRVNDLDADEFNRDRHA